ncbi:hypothetical protein [Actinomadura roseirufa]|uniref:hypothetical protein n=1 Tax=Actinomadura roseirufa TaxID=2094049 RepID=UPI001040F474|nr:hypothetical protein [Actinomadura roseirufa]
MIAGVLAALPVLSGCGSDDPPQDKVLPRIVSTEVAAGKTVRLTDAGPVPKRLVAGPGDRITWRNESSVPRVVRLMDGSVPSQAIAPGGTYAHTFSTSGTFAYRLGADSGGAAKGGASTPPKTPVEKPTQALPDGVVEINLPAVQPRP